jgi:competence ComEA-like helix-hairpin-helix protein
MKMKRGILLLMGIACLAIVFAVLPYGATRAAEMEGQLNLNTATVEDLQMLPDMSAEMAQNIVNFREINGPFASSADLIKVEGCTDADIEKWSPWLITEGESTLKIME